MPKIPIKIVTNKKVARHREQNEELGLLVDKITRECFFAEIRQLFREHNEKSSGTKLGHMCTKIKKTIEDDHLGEFVLLLLKFLY